MPPKAVKKLTKKELKEIEEQKKKEEEEKRKKEEEEKEKIRKEQERKRKLEEERLAAEERQRLLEENQQLETWRNTVKQAREQENLKLQQIKDWEKWQDCDPKPDPQNESQLTTFITQYKESGKIKPKKMEGLQIEKALNNIQYSEVIAGQIQELYMRAMGDNRFDDQKRYFSFIQQIRQITALKLEEMTAALCVFAEDMADQKAKEILDQQEGAQQQKQFKQDNKHQNEVYRIFPVLPDFRFGMWINPNNKGGFRHKPIEFSDLSKGIETGMAMDLPQKLMNMMLIMRAYWTSYDYCSDPDKYSKDIIMGGIMNVECLEYLPQMKKGLDWNLKHDYEIKEAIKKQHYPPLDQQAQNANVQSFRVMYQLPPYLLLYKDDQPRLALWDEINKTWNTELFELIKFDYEKKMLDFKAFRLAPFSYIQERCTDYPYVSWKLRCVKENVAFLDIQGKRDTFCFEIGPGYALLRRREEKELAHIIEKKMTTGGLLYQLQKSGIHLLPIPEDAAIANISAKDAKTEDAAILDVVSSVRSFFIKSSRFSFKLKNDKILLRIRENLAYDEFFAEDQEKDWKSILWYNNKVACVKSRDSHNTCNEAMVEDTVAHANLSVLLTTHQLTEQDFLERMKETQHIIFQDTLTRFIKLTHLLTFTAGKEVK